MSDSTHAAKMAIKMINHCADKDLIVRTYGIYVDDQAFYLGPDRYQDTYFIKVYRGAFDHIFWMRITADGVHFAKGTQFGHGTVSKISLTLAMKIVDRYCP